MQQPMLPASMDLGPAVTMDPSSPRHGSRPNTSSPTRTSPCVGRAPEAATPVRASSSRASATAAAGPRATAVSILLMFSRSLAAPRTRQRPSRRRRRGLRRRGAHGGGRRGRHGAGGNWWPRQETLALLNPTADRPQAPALRRRLHPARRGRPELCQPWVRGASKAGTRTSGLRI